LLFPCWQLITEKGIRMPKYLWGTPRVKAARRLFASLGGTPECFYFAFGALAINNSGKARGHVTPLMTPEEMNQVITKSPAYRAPGES
jgi:hypothetical protein